MSLVEAQSIIQEKRNREPILSEQLAARMRETVGAKLDDSVVLQDLYYAAHTQPDSSAGLDWHRFYVDINSRERQAITSSLGGLSFMKNSETGKRITVGDIRSVDDIRTFAKPRGYYKSVFGISFFKLAFEKGVVNV